MEPIFFNPFFEEKPWGGSRLCDLYNKYPPGINIGESWELSSVTYRQTYVRNGDYSGYMLSELYRCHPEFFGTSSEYFPFVIKFIDAHEKMPLIINGGGLKSDADQFEGDYIIFAEEPVQLVSGTTLKNNLELFNAIADNSIEDKLERIYLNTGDSFIVSPGSPHAIETGALIYKISTPLIETSKIYDYGKYSEFDLENMATSFRFQGGTVKVEQRELAPGRFSVIETERFCVELIDAVVTYKDTSGEVFSCYTSLAPGYIENDGRRRSFRAAETFLVPAGFGDYSITGGRLLKAMPRE